MLHNHNLIDVGLFRQNYVKFTLLLYECSQTLVKLCQGKRIYIYIYYNMYKCFGYKGHEWRPKMFLKYSIECSFHFQILFTLGCKHKFYNGRKLNKLKKVSQIYFCINQVVSTISIFLILLQKVLIWFYLCCDLDLSANFFFFFNLVVHWFYLRWGLDSNNGPLALTLLEICCPSSGDILYL